MFWLLLVVLCALLMFSQAVLSAAADAALLWWTRVLPALLPYLILTGLAVRCRPRLPAVGRLHPYALLSLLLGAIGGYPVGARVLGEGLQTGALSDREARRFSLAASLPSPSFLISVTALGLFACPAAAPVLCAAVYGTALLLFLLCSFSRADAPPLAEARALSATDVSGAIMDGMNAILRIGGCIVLCRCLAAVLEAAGLVRVLSGILPWDEAVTGALLAGLLEMTSGTAAVAALPLPLFVRLPLCVFLQVFGGASVLLQIRCFLPVKGFRRVVMARLGMATLAALVCYGLLQLLPPALAPAMASPDEMLQRAALLPSLLLPCALGLVSAVLFGIWLTPGTAQK